MALARLDVPGARPLQRHDLPGHVQGPRPDDRVRVRGGRRLPRRQDQPRRAVRDRERGLPRRGRLRRPVHGQHDVDGPGVPGPLAGRPQRHPGRGPGQGRGGAPGRRAGDDARPPRHPAVARSSPGSAIENAIASVAATGGSTNGVLHLLAIAHEFGIPLTIDEFDAIADRTPIVADMRPGGRYTAVGPVRRRRRGAGHARAAQARPAPRRGEERRRADDREDRRGRRRRPRASRSSCPIETPLKPTGGLAILHGSLAPEGCVVKLAGHERPPPPRAGPRLRLARPACFEAVKNRQIVAGRRRRDPLRGPGRRPGHAGDAERHRRRSSARASASPWRCSPTAASPAAPTG